ncbi:MAG: M56 family metallopeptidase [Peptococcaceae bacterium]|nr:M56 family metallopeptidase [Peptococcaceae bacterium]
MIGDIFYWVLNISILGSVAGLIVMFLRRVSVFPRFGVYLLWTLPLIRFWIPVGIANQYSLLSFISQYTTKTIVVWEVIPGSPAFSMTNSIQAAESYFPIVYKTNLLKNIWHIAGTIWVIVAVAAILCSVLLYIFTKAALKDAEHIKENIYQSDKVFSPAVYGIIKPKIILPADVAKTGLEYILKHEGIHIRRRDNLWRVVAVVTACVHWFNPFVWFCLKYFFSDMELACDAGVLKTLKDNDKKDYAAALLACSAGKTYYASAFGGAKTKLRIENILSYKKLTLFSSLCFAALFMAVAVTVITNAAAG